MYKNTEHKVKQTLCALHKGHKGISKSRAQTMFVQEAGLVHKSHLYRLKLNKTQPKQAQGCAFSVCNSVWLAICTNGIQLFHVSPTQKYDYFIIIVNVIIIVNDLLGISPLRSPGRLDDGPPGKILSRSLSTHPQAILRQSTIINTAIHYVYVQFPILLKSRHFCNKIIIRVYTRLDKQDVLSWEEWAETGKYFMKRLRFFFFSKHLFFFFVT